MPDQPGLYERPGWLIEIWARYKRLANPQGPLPHAMRTWNASARRVYQAMGKPPADPERLAILDGEPLPGTIEAVQNAQANDVALLLRDVGALLERIEAVLRLTEQ